MDPILKQISNVGIVPVIAIDDAKKAVPLAKALVAGGLPVAEVTFRTAAAEEAMRAIVREVPEMLVGAGTVPLLGNESTRLTALVDNMLRFVMDIYSGELNYLHEKKNNRRPF